MSSKTKSKLIPIVAILSALVILQVFVFRDNTRNALSKIIEPDTDSKAFNEERYKGEKKKEYEVIFIVTGNRATGRVVKITWTVGRKSNTEPQNIGGFNNRTWKHTELVEEGQKLALVVENTNNPGYSDCRIIVNGLERVREFAYEWDNCSAYSMAVP